MSGTLIFWVAAAALTVGLGALLFAFSALAARKALSAGPEDPSMAVYRRQLEELDELAGRGLLPEAEQRAARAEAGRRLISAADRGAKPETAGGKVSRVALLAGGIAAAAGAIALYLVLGSPGVADQPFKTRVKGWMSSDLEFLPPQELAAVLRQVVAKRPQDIQGLTYLGKAEIAAGESANAARTFGHARRLEPNNLELVALEAQALLTESEDKVTPEVEAALKRVLALSPQDPMARYYLAKAAVDAGRTEEGIKGWRALADELPVGDERRLQLEQQIAQASGKTSLAETVAKSEAPAQQAFIKAMVSRLAGRLKEKPDDPEGWARLIRAYGVLGDKEEQQRALASARKVYAQRPGMMLEIEKSAEAPQ